MTDSFVPPHEKPDPANRITTEARAGGSVTRDLRLRLRFPRLRPEPTAVRNANAVAASRLTPLDRFAIAITNRVGSIGFFFIILTWTVTWTGYNTLATELPRLHWRSFDPFPAFVAYLLISNVIQILLMPLILVGQNLQSRHAEARAELDFEINKKAEQEVALLFRHIERNTELVIHLMRHVECRLTDEELAEIDRNNREAVAIMQGHVEAPDGS